MIDRFETFTVLIAKISRNIRKIKNSSKKKDKRKIKEKKGR